MSVPLDGTSFAVYRDHGIVELNFHRKAVVRTFLDTGLAVYHMATVMARLCATKEWQLLPDYCTDLSIDHSQPKACLGTV